MRGEAVMKLAGSRLSAVEAAGIIIVLACCGSVALAPWLAPHDPNLLMGQRWAAPSLDHWLGLDHLGRDMLSRLLHGGRISIAVALLATLLAMLAGMTAGLAAAILGRWTDTILARVADILLMMPALISALVVISAVGASPLTLIVTLGVLQSLVVFRMVRALAIRMIALDYVRAARLRGESWLSAILREVLPNARAPLAAEFGLRFCFCFLFVAALGFLGLGPETAGADWGTMVRDNAFAISAGVVAPLYPAGAIALLAIGVNLVVGALSMRTTAPV